MTEDNQKPNDDCGTDSEQRHVMFRAYSPTSGMWSWDMLLEHDFIGLKDLQSREDWFVMQFTGLQDKNCKDIYEGDIDKNGWIVTYCGDQGAGLGMGAGWYLQRDNFESWIELESRSNANGDNYEIIGNMHEGVVSGT